MYSTFKIIPYDYTEIPAQLVRVRTTNNIWGFSFLNLFGNRYQVEYTLNYQFDNVIYKQDNDIQYYEGSTFYINLSPLVIDILREPESSLVTAFA